MQTAVVWSCLPFIGSGQNHLARHSERGKKTRQTEKEVGRQHQGMDRPGVRQVPEGSGEQGKMEETGCEIICGTPTTFAVNAQMMMTEICLLAGHLKKSINITIKYFFMQIRACICDFHFQTWAIFSVLTCSLIKAGTVSARLNLKKR